MLQHAQVYSAQKTAKSQWLTTCDMVTMPNMGGTWDNVTNSIWDHNPNLAEILNVIMVTWLSISGHTFAHAIPNEVSWEVQNYDMTEVLFHTY